MQREVPMNSSQLSWISKVLAILLIALLVLFLFSLQPTGQAQYANIHCCLTTCQEMLLSDCPGEIRTGSFCKVLPECHVGCCIDPEGYCYDNYLRESCSAKGTFFAGGCVNKVECVTEKTIGDPVGNIGIPLLYAQDALVFAEPLAASRGTPVTIKVFNIQQNNATTLEVLIKNDQNYSSSLTLFDDGWHGDGNARDQLFAGVWRGENLSAFEGYQVFTILAPGGQKSQLILSSTHCLPFLPALAPREKAVIFTSSGREGNINFFFPRAQGIMDMMLRISGEPGSNQSNIFPQNQYNYFFWEGRFADDSPSALPAALAECSVNDAKIIHLSSDIEVCRQEGNMYRVNSSFILLPNETITSQDEYLNDFCSRITTENEMKKQFLQKTIRPSVDVPFISLGDSNSSQATLEFIINDNQLELNYTIFYDLDHPLTTLAEGVAHSNETVRKTISVPDGQHSLIVKAVDADRNYGYSDPFSVYKNVNNFWIEIVSLEKIVYLSPPDINFTIYHTSEAELGYTIMIDKFIYPGMALANIPQTFRAEMARGEHLISIASTDGKVNATSLPYFIIIGEEEEPALIPAYPLEDTTE